MLEFAKYETQLSKAWESISSAAIAVRCYVYPRKNSNIFKEKKKAKMNKINYSKLVSKAADLILKTRPAKELKYSILKL